jgi:hypothetical protein
VSTRPRPKRREVIEDTEAWRAAEPVRRGYVAGLLAREAPPPGPLRSCGEQILATGDRGHQPADLVAEPIVDTPSPATL